MMAFDEGNRAPPPAPVARLPRLPSNAEIVRPHNADVALLILRAVLSRGAHRPGGHTYREVAALLWENSPIVTGPFFGRFQEWVPAQIQRNMKERASSVIGHYSVFESEAVPHLSPLQRLASQLHNEITAIAEAENTRREAARLAAESRQAANAHHEGALGLVSAGYGATPPTMYGVDPSVRLQNENASALLALNPRSQNDQANPVRAQVLPPPPAPHNGDTRVVGEGVGAICGNVGDAHDVVAIGAIPPIIQVPAADPPIVQVAAADPPIIQAAGAEDPPIVQAAAGIPNAIQVQAGAALAPNVHVPVLPGIVGPANARAQAIANRRNLAAAAGNNRPPTVVDQEDVVNMRRPRNRDNVEIYDAMQRSILQATNALTRAMEGRAQPPPPPALQPPPLLTITPLRHLGQEELGEQIDSLYERLKVAREMGMEDSAVRCERQIVDLETRDEELTRKRFLDNFLA